MNDQKSGEHTGSCLYGCGDESTSSQLYHVLPESGSNLNVTLPAGIVCDNCNSYFSKLENYFIQHHPGSSQRLFRLARTKKGREPKLTTADGEATRVRQHEGIEVSLPLGDLQFKRQEDGSLLVQGNTRCREFDATKVSRVLAKIALESMWLESEQTRAYCYSDELAPMREYARHGSGALRFVQFAYRTGELPEVPPQVYGVQVNDAPVGNGCFIHFPGSHYFIPYPPLAIEYDLERMEGWMCVTEAGLHKTPDLATEITLVPKSSGPPS